MINTQNASNLNITLSNTGANFNALDNDWIIAKITNNYSTTIVDSTGVLLPIVYHGWIAMPSQAESLILSPSETAGYGYISTEATNGIPDTIINPAVSLTGATIANGTLVYLRYRGSHSTYNGIFECITMGSGGAVSSVQCTGNYLYVTYQ
jgi:hypothetical protein